MISCHLIFISTYNFLITQLMCNAQLIYGYALTSFSNHLPNNCRKYTKKSGNCKTVYPGKNEW